MDRKTIVVPAGYRYISEIPSFKLHDFPHILNKQIPGCGFTEYCITNNENVILCSPRKILLQNKYDQHKDEVFLVVNEYEQEPRTDKDLVKLEKYKSSPYKTKDEIEKERQELENAKKNFFQELTKKLTGYINKCLFEERPIKILVTYDSYRLVKEIIHFNYSNVDFRVIIDEFQSIFTDSKFKSDTELQFVSNLQGVQKVCYVSATPMIDKYLDMLDEFKNLPYYELDWSSQDSSRVKRPMLYVKTLKAVYTEVKPIIEKYVNGNFDHRFVKDRNGKVRRIESKEAVFYVNSVNNITNIIKRAGLKPEQVNILVANTQDNIRKIQKRLGKKFDIGRVPLRDEPRKMFTFCTRTVYLGADFYSDNAQSFVVSDANIDTLAVDISLDLPQILGRQRLRENPWKDEATLFFRAVTSGNKKPEEEFNKKMDDKIECSEGLLKAFDEVSEKNQAYLSEVYQDNARAWNYKKNFVAVNPVKNPDGSIKLVPVFNNLVRVAELRAYEIQQVDYADRFTVFSELDKLNDTDVNNEEFTKFFEGFNKQKDRRRKLKFLCESSHLPGFRTILDNVPNKRFKEYIDTLGVDGCKSLSYKIEQIDKKLSVLSFDLDKVRDVVYNTFEVGKSYTKSSIKLTLAKLYKDIGYKATAKANDLNCYFKTRETLISDGLRRTAGFKLLEKIEDNNNDKN
jgi:hypothetical protein